jgi:uncharacterized protein (DUF302 family)
MHFFGNGMIHITWAALAWLISIALTAALVWVIANNLARSRLLKQYSLTKALDLLAHPDQDASPLRGTPFTTRDPLADIEYGVVSVLDEQDFERNVESVSSALRREGFEILASIALDEVFIKRLGGDFRRYRILIVGIASLMQETVVVEPHMGLLIPHHVVIQERPDGKAMVSATTPTTMYSMIRNPKLHYLTKKSEQELKRVIYMLSQKRASP